MTLPQTSEQSSDIPANDAADATATTPAASDATDAAAAQPAHPGPGHIRSFVHRRGHITQRQKDALSTLVPKWSIPYQAAPLQATEIFGREAPLILEIGFGMGETTARIAAARSTDNFLGVEVFQAGVGALAQRLEDQQLKNVRIIQHDAVEVVRDMLLPDTLAGIHVYFPDPWPKKRHHKRRLIQAPFVALLASRLAPGGYLHCATDWEPYAQQMVEVLSQEPSLENTAKPGNNGFAERPEWRPETKFEARGRRLGHGSWDVIFKRRAS